MHEKITYVTSDPTSKEQVEKSVQSWLNDEKNIQIFTSGSTGAPSQISLEKAYMRASVRMTGTFFNFQENETMGLCLTTTSIGGKMALIRALEYKMNCLVLPVQRNPLVDLKTPIDFISMVPTQLHQILEETPEKLDLVKCILLGGAPIHARLLEKIQGITSTVYASFGMTETISHIALRKLNHGTEPYFTALPGVVISTRNEQLLIEAPHLGIKELLTNDRVLLHGKQQFEWLGRLDFVLNVGGKKISPEHIERKLEQYLECRFFISSFPDEQWNEKIVLFVETELSPEEISRKIPLQEVLEKYELPKIIVSVKAFEETLSGKVNRLETRKKYLESNA